MIDPIKAGIFFTFIKTAMRTVQYRLLKIYIHLFTPHIHKQPNMFVGKQQQRQQKNKQTNKKNIFSFRNKNIFVHSGVEKDAVV